MKTYLVGGAVRDKLLGLEPTEKDWVVVGATVENMLELGYQQVGKENTIFCKLVAFPFYLCIINTETYVFITGYY